MKRVITRSQLEAELQTGTVDMSQVLVVPDEDSPSVIGAGLDFDVGLPEDEVPVYEFSEPDDLTEDWAL